MKKLILILLPMLLGLAACQSEKIIREQHTGVTGKSNGGDSINIDREMIIEKIENLKPLLILLFEGMRDQAVAEISVPGSTDLAGHPQLIEVLIRMTHIGVGNPLQFVEDDINTEGNFLIQDSACLDYTGDDHFAATNVGEIGGEICFSVDMISNGFATDSEKSFDIQLLALAAHEFLHHFYDSGSHDQDEAVAEMLQRFVVYQLHKYSEFDEDIIATNSTGYLQRFVVESRRIRNRSKQAEDLSDEAFEQLLREGGER